MKKIINIYKEIFMKKRLFKSAAVFLIAALCLPVLLSACAGEPDWDGTFYLWINSSEYKVIVIEAGANIASISLGNLETYDNGGYGYMSVGSYGDIIKKNTIEDWNYRYTLSGDNLTVKSLDGDETEYEGKYTRGRTVEARFGSDENEFAEIPFLLGEPYYLYGDEDEEYIIFYEDGTAYWSYEEYTWTYREPYISVTVSDDDESAVSVSVAFEVSEWNILFDVIGREFRIIAVG